MLHGKEIYLFFNIYGINGIIGIIISQVIIGAIIYKVFMISKKQNIDDYTELIEKINTKSKLSEIIGIIITTFLLITFYIMIAGFSAYFSQELGVPQIIGTITILIICYIILKGNIEGITKLNIALIPILIIFILILTTKNIEVYSNINEKMTDTSLIKSIYKAILYSSYNSITIIPIIISLKDYIKNKKDILKTSLICTILLTILAISIYGLILKVDIDINMLELPTVYVAGMNGKIYKYMYGIIILVAIATSAISTGYSILKKYEKNQKRYKKMLLILCISSTFISKIGFSNLINLLYPIFGLLGLIQIILIIKNKKTIEKKR